MTRYIKFEGSCYYLGAAFEEYLKTNMSDKELDGYARELIEWNAPSYAYLVFGGTQLLRIQQKKKTALLKKQK